MLVVHTFCNHFTSICGLVFDIWTEWHIVILSPIFLMFLLPLMTLFLLYGTALFLYIYKHRRRQIFDACASNFWEGARIAVAAFYDAQATLWHGYEVHGLENIPDEGGALLIYYHGALPVDVYYMMGRLKTAKKRNLRNVVAEFMFHIPGFKILMDVFGCVTGPVDECVKILKEGDLLAISPGGPVIPVFTQNVRESFRTLKMGRRFFRWIYEHTKCPIVPIWGGFPVKLKTYFGKPMFFDPCMKYEEVAISVHRAVQELIKEHQRVPGSILRGLKERFHNSNNNNYDNIGKKKND
eukprot:gene4609-5215_t